MPRWFLILNGIALFLMGMAMLSSRLRERPFHRAMFGILWALMCCAAGTVLLLMATGHLEQPGMRKPPPPRSHIPEFPTGK